MGLLQVLLKNIDYLPFLGTMQSLEESDTFLIDHVLEAVDDMTDSKQPKVLLFDIGGVCVSSSP